MKIVFLDTRTMGQISNLKKLEQFGHVTYHQDTANDQVIARIKDADIVITNKVKVSEEAMQNAPLLKLICVAATGMNNIDLKAAEKMGIGVKNVKGYSAHSVAQHTFALVLSLLNATAYYDNYVKSGEYATETIFTHHGKPFWELKNKIYGIIGLGDIGRQVAAIAHAFGAKVVYYSPSQQTYNVEYEPIKDLHHFLKIADVVSIHTPLNEYTQNLIGYEQIKQMKPTALLINTSRGGIINETNLAKALDDELIAGAGIDVFVEEPMAANHPYLQLKNPEKIILTPHMAWASVESRTLLMEKIIANMQNFLYQKT